MTQYDDTVERQRLLIEAEKWADGIQSLHSHRLASMWYDTRPQDTKEGQYVMDTQYNGGFIKREVYNNKQVLLEEVTFGKRLSGEDLINEYNRKTA